MTNFNVVVYDWFCMGGSSYPSDWDQRRRQVYQRDGYTCQRCGRGGGPNGMAELHAHHKVPRSKGGSHSLSNLETLCRECHNQKHPHRIGSRQPSHSYNVNNTEDNLSAEPTWEEKFERRRSVGPEGEMDYIPQIPEAYNYSNRHPMDESLSSRPAPESYQPIENKTSEHSIVDTFIYIVVLLILLLFLVGAGILLFANFSIF